VKQVSAYKSLHNEFAACRFSSIDELCDDWEGNGDSEEVEDVGKHEPKPVPSFAEAYTAC
jgi:hypothetical protein